MFNELTEVKCFKEIKVLNNLQVKEPKRESMMVVFCEKS